MRAWTPGKLTWRIRPTPPGAADLARRLGKSPLTAALLAQRGLTGPEEAQAYLEPKLSHLHDPLELGGCAEAAARVALAVREGKSIVLYGDYDVDGMTGLAILHAVLKIAGAEPALYVPHRLEEGYGLNHDAIERICADGAQMLVTVDCGISAAEEVARARKAGLEVVITDHHALGTDRPDASAIVHPALPEADYPNPALCGAGVALKLAWQLARELCGQHRVDETMREFLLDATCLAALGTIADLVPLTGENRVLAYHGLIGLGASRHPGIRALLESANLVGERLDSFHVGFRLAPRLNACGRMGHAREAVELLTEASPERAAQIAGYLTRQNAQRQKIEREIAAEAIDRVEAEGLDGPDTKVIVLASRNWHGGVIGIVASRLVDRFARPAVLIALNGDGVGQGSARSVPGFAMHEALSACRKHLLGCGGHAMAGGLRIADGNVDAFAEAMNAFGRAHLPETPGPEVLEIDAEADLGHVDMDLARTVSRMGPFGEGNPQPVIALRGLKVVRPPRRMGRTGSTVGLYLGQGNASIRAVGFGMGELVDKLAGVNEIHVAAEPTINEFRGRTSVELKLRDVTW